MTIDRHPVRFFVHKRPHVDFFLSVVSNLGLNGFLLLCLTTRCLNGLSWLFSLQVWKSMGLLSLISWTAIKECSTGGTVELTYVMYRDRSYCTRKIITVPVYLSNQGVFIRRYYPQYKLNNLCSASFKVLPAALHAGLWVVHQRPVCNLC